MKKLQLKRINQAEPVNMDTTIRAFTKVRAQSHPVELEE
jgi:hypothetical protein